MGSTSFSHSQAEFPGKTCASGEPQTSAADAASAEGRLWRPRRVYITPDAHALPYGRTILDRAAALGAEVIRLKQNRITGLRGDTEQQVYALAKTSLAIVVAPPGARRLQPIPPSADWQFHLAQGCPAHCQYCYLAGSLSGPPITRVYANIPEILENLRQYAGKGNVTSASAARADEGTTFEASCYTDPLGIEHLTGSLGEAVRFFGAWEEPVQLRFTTKFSAVGPLLALPHQRHTRIRFSLNAAGFSRDFEGGTATVTQRIRALRRMALAGYPVGLTIAPIVRIPGWQGEYAKLFADVATTLDGITDADLTVELITHRFTAGSREVLLGWYPKTTLDLAKENRAEKRNKFGGFKYVYPKNHMGELREWFYAQVARQLPQARILYWT